MKKYLSVFIILLFITNSAYAKVIEGKVTYTEESARSILFQNAKMFIPLNTISRFMTDPNFTMNRDLIKYGIQSDNRCVEVYKKGSLKLAYSVTYNENPKYTYYYIKMNGQLMFVDIEESMQQKDSKKARYPVKFYKYNREGKLVAAGIMISENEGFLYDNNQKLITHRLNNIGYNKNGKQSWMAEELEF